ncbi:DUF2341 domain-containing protein, partial [Candidatus Dojkabacteria bacterium]|nr:DUF2341 domain-containing protein [Candidatus Dojkabacteria bacterium]
GWSVDYANWGYRKKITFDNTDAFLGLASEDLIDFPVLVKLVNGVNIDYTKTKDAGEDVRFTDNDGSVLSYEIELWDESGSSFVWVKVPKIDINSNTDSIYLYYGNNSATDSQNPSDVWSNNYAMVQHLKDNLSTNVKDSTSNAYVGTKRLTNSPLQIDGKIGKAQQFGTSDYIDLGNILNPGTNSFTVETWFRRQTNGGANGSILYNKENLYETSAGGGYVTYAWQPHWAWDGGNSAAFSLNQWTKTTTVFDHTNQYLYLNGNQVFSRSQIGNIGTNTSRLQIGARGDTGHASFFVGDIDELRVSMVARSNAWLAASYKSDEATLTSFGSEEQNLPSSGVLTSNVFDPGFASDWGNLVYATTGSGSASVKVRSDSNSDMSTATNWASCSSITSGTDISSNNCVNDEQRYIQYQVTLQPSGASNISFTSISIDYSASDQNPPTSNASLVSNPNEDDWTNAEETFSWQAGADDPSGNGLLGYCVALDEYDVSSGSTSSIDPAISSGILSGLNDGVSETYCPFIVTGTSIDLSTISGLTLTSGNYYTLSIKAVDLAGNVFTGASNEYQDLSKFKYDNTPPTDPAYVSLPGNFVSTKEVTFIWPTTGPDAPSDADSGFLGVQYRIGTNGTWYGDLHLGTEDENDLLVNDGAYTTDPTYDYPNIVEGTNKIYFRTFDNAGNVTSPTTEKTVLKVNSIAPSSVIGLSVTPTNNTVNEYTFTWSPPTSFTGQVGNLTYCYTVNSLPDAGNCNYTDKGQTTLASDAYASRPGSNVMYIVAKDEAGNINYETYSFINFSYSGTAPGIANNLDVADISIKVTQKWRLVLTWDQPTNIGAGVSSYKVLRSTQNAACSANVSAFSTIGTTSGTSYVDDNLEQKDYFYCVRACDSANNCSAVSGTVSEYPTGKFTSPAELISAPDVSLVTTKRAVISWVTDRESDTKIAYGKVSGKYFEEESYKQTQEV